MKLKKLLKLVDYKIYNGDKYLWSCYGDDAMVFEHGGYGDPSYISPNENVLSLNSVVDMRTQKVREITCCFYTHEVAFRWIDPDYVKAYKQEAKEKKVKQNEAWDGIEYVDVPLDSMEIIAKEIAKSERVDYDKAV